MMQLLVEAPHSSENVSLANDIQTLSVAVASVVWQ